MNKYEEIAKKDQFGYLALWAAYTKRGRAIPDGCRVVMTEWAYENGFGRRKKCTGVKTGNSRSVPGSIRVRLDGNKQATSWWAGFWETKK